jgi:hypothetical protein
VAARRRERLASGVQLLHDAGFLGIITKKNIAAWPEVETGLRRSQLTV